jgi:class 3 adenylate cyclase
MSATSSSIMATSSATGDGVNVAARLKGIAQPGGFCISGAAYEQVRDKVPFAFTDRGEQSVKNIAHPVHVYALGADDDAVLGQVPARIETIRSPERGTRRLRSVVRYSFEVICASYKNR